MTLIEYLTIFIYVMLFITLLYLIVHSIISVSDSNELYGWVLLLLAWICISLIVAVNMGWVTFPPMLEGSLYVVAAVFAIASFSSHYISDTSSL